MLANGVKGLFVYSVDNAVVRVADPVFVGYCMTQVYSTTCTKIYISHMTCSGDLVVVLL